jgi:hypothetical protein
MRVPERPRLLMNAIADDTTSLHADKYTDPRVRVTSRGIWLGVLLAVVATVAALGSIYARRTRLEKSTEFWGRQTIESLQLAGSIKLKPLGDGSIKTIELTGTPGLGHLRRAILDERHYDWTTVESASAVAECDGRTIGKKNLPGCVRLQLSDAFSDPKRFPDVEIEMNLVEGWIGPHVATTTETAPQKPLSRVRFSEHVRPKLQNYFATIMNVEQLKYDDRE